MSFKLKCSFFNVVKINVPFNNGRYLINENFKTLNFVRR